MKRQVVVCLLFLELFWSYLLFVTFGLGVVTFVEGVSDRFRGGDRVSLTTECDFL